jgi:hypothetical protein
VKEVVAEDANSIGIAAVLGRARRLSDPRDVEKLAAAIERTCFASHSVASRAVMMVGRPLIGLSDAGR